MMSTQSRTQNRTKARTTYQQQAPQAKLGSGATRQIGISRQAVVVVSSQDNLINESQNSTLKETSMVSRTSNNSGGSNFISPRLLERSSNMQLVISEQDELNSKSLVQGTDNKNRLDSNGGSKGSVISRKDQFKQQIQTQSQFSAANKLKKPTMALSSTNQKLARMSEKQPITKQVDLKQKVNQKQGSASQHQTLNNSNPNNDVTLPLPKQQQVLKHQQTQQISSSNNKIINNRSPQTLILDAELSPVQNEADAMKPKHAIQQQFRDTSDKKNSNQNVNSSMSSGPEWSSSKPIISTITNKMVTTSEPFRKERSIGTANGIADDDELVDDFLDDSMELQESNTIASSSKTQSKTNSANKDKSNKVYLTSPSKAIDKFSHQRGQRNAKQQDVKPSAIQGKKTLIGLQEQSKPLAQLELNISMCNLSTINIQQISNQSLRSIDIRNNQIVDLPIELFMLENLWKLQLDSNQIKVIPQDIRKLKQLKILSIASNYISDIPQELFELGDSLEKLDISGNKISFLSSDIRRLSKIKWLLLQNNPLCQLPLSLHSLAPNLQQFGLDWFLYLAPLCESILKKPDQKDATDNTMPKVLDIFTQEAQKTIGSDAEITFIDFISKFYKKPVINTKQFFGNTYTNSGRQSTIMHTLCKHNHGYLLESQILQYKQFIDINQADTQGETALMTALNEKNETIIKFILKEFKNTLDFSRQDYHQIMEMASPNKRQLLMHPLMISVKKQMLPFAIEILDIMKDNNQKGNSMAIDLNIKDENKNTLMHHLFMNFSTNMELNVELCQQVLKLNDQICTNYYANENQMSHGKSGGNNLSLRLNDVNKQGASPIDLAVDLKQNQALEFAIYYNKNMLPALQQGSVVKNKFDLNSNKNSRGIAPIHRAIIAQNYKAIFLLLTSDDCNLFIKDKEFKSAKDYCNKVLFLSKYIRKGENNYVRQFLHERDLIVSKSEQYQKKNNALTVKTALLASQKAITHNNITLYQMSKRHNRVKYNSWYTRIENRNMLSSSQMPTQERKPDGEEELEAVRLEDMKECEYVEDEEPPKVSSSSDSKISMANTLSVQSRKATVIDSICSEQSIQNHNPSLNKLAIDLTMNQQRKQFGTIQSKNQQSEDIYFRTQVNGSNNYQSQSIVSLDSLRPQKYMEQIDGENKSGLNNKSQNSGRQSILVSVENQINEECADFDENEENEDDDSEGNQNETPAALLNKQSKYVMNVNSSKLARKSYYKSLQKNRFEIDFCYIMDSRQPHSGKLQKLYQLYSIIKQNKNEDLIDGKQFLSFLKLELDQKDENILPLKNEISYFEDLIEQTIQLQIKNGNNKNYGFRQRDLSPSNNIRINKNRSLERGPLPPIKEAIGENNQIISPIKMINSNIDQTNSNIRSLQQPQVTNRSNQQLIKNYETTLIDQKKSSVQKDRELSMSKNCYSANTAVEIPPLQVHRLTTSASKKSLESNGGINYGTVNSTIHQNNNKPIGIFKIQTTARDESDRSENSNSQSKQSIGNNVYMTQSKTSTSIKQIATSPRANSGQVRSKANPIPIQKKDSIVKKIEVQIISDSGVGVHHTSSTNQQHHNSHSVESKQKWKQLTINPNAATLHNSNVANNNKINQIANKTLTPQSLKNQIQTSSVSITNSGQSSIKNQNTHHSIQVQSNINKTSQHQSSNNLVATTTPYITSSQLINNRSNSNPRNSLSSSQKQGATGVNSNTNIKSNLTIRNTEEMKSSHHSFGSPVSVSQKQTGLGSSGLPSNNQSQNSTNLTINVANAKAKPLSTKANSFRATKTNTRLGK